MATAQEIRAAAEYVPPIQFGMSEHARYGGICITSKKGEDVWDVLVKLKNAHEILADAYLALVNRTASEAAKAAESEIIQRSDELADAIADGLPAGEIASIIQRHTPPVNERLFDALADLTDMLTNPLREGFALVNPESLLPIQEARKAIAEARAALEEK